MCFAGSFCFAIHSIRYSLLELLAMKITIVLTINCIETLGTCGNWKKHFTVTLNETVDQWIKKEEHKVATDLDGFHFRYE